MVALLDVVGLVVEEPVVVGVLREAAAGRPVAVLVQATATDLAVAAAAEEAAEAESEGAEEGGLRQRIPHSATVG